MKKLYSYNIMNREYQTYQLDRKIISIHSEDRNIDKWPNANEFEITLPEDLLNVQSIRLVNVNFPSVIYTFSKYYHNTKLRFQVIPNTTNETQEISLNQKLQSDISYFEIEIQEGTYDPDQLAFELTAKMNRQVSQYLQTEYNHFNVHANTVNYTFLFGNNRDQIVYLFGQQIPYQHTCTKHNIWEQTMKWGLPYFLGFNKQNIQSISYEEFYIDYEGDNEPWLSPSSDSCNNLVWVKQSAFPYQLLGENEVYIELENHNSIMEMIPYPKTLHNNLQYSGIPNSAFAKISLFNATSAQIFDSRNGFLTNITHYIRPIERIRKFKFKVRFHDGRLVDFKQRHWGMTLEVNQIIDQPLYHMNIQKPHFYNL